MSENYVTYIGTGLLGLPQITLIVLEICNVVDWEWWLVLLPFEIYATIFAIGLITAVVRAIADKISGY